MRTKIYSLADPRQPDLIRYVGKTRLSLDARLREHLKPCRLKVAGHKNHWINELLRAGIKPEIRVVLCVPVEHEDAAEREIINRLKAAGVPLTNGRPGGEGGALPPDLQARATEKLRKLAAEGKGRPVWTPETRARVNRIISDRMRADNPMKRAAVKAKNSASQSRVHAAKGHHKRISLTKKGTPEWRASKAPDDNLYSHAWVLDLSNEGTACFSGILDGVKQHFMAMADEYRSELNVQEETTYTIEDAVALDAAYGHCGPWIERYRVLCRKEPDEKRKHEGDAAASDTDAEPSTL